MSNGTNITLENIGGDGAAEELFQEKLAVVLADIADPNAKAKAKREVTIKVVFPVDEDRQMFAPEIHVAHKLAPREPVRGHTSKWGPTSKGSRRRFSGRGSASRGLSSRIEKMAARMWKRSPGLSK
jgi:hypothetical protein